MKLEIYQECGATVRPLWPETLGPGSQNVTSRSFAESVTKGAWREQILSLKSRRDMRRAPVCVVLWARANDWGLFWQVWERGQSRIHTGGHLLGAVNAGRCQVGPNEKWQECEIKGISCKILTCKTELQSDLTRLKLHKFVFPVSYFPLNGNKMWFKLNVSVSIIFVVIHFESVIKHVYTV